MGFDFSFAIDEFATELKQHLNLSSPAWLTIDEDIQNFYPSEKEESFSGFLNRIFHNFYQTAEASVNLRYQEKKKHCRNYIPPRNSNPSMGEPSIASSPVTLASMRMN